MIVMFEKSSGPSLFLGIFSMRVHVYTGTCVCARAHASLCVCVYMSLLMHACMLVEDLGLFS